MPTSSFFLPTRRGGIMPSLTASFAHSFATVKLRLKSFHGPDCSSGAVSF